MGLSEIIEAIGQGAQHGYNRETLGPDYAQKLAEFLQRKKAAALAAQVTEQQLGKGRRAERDAQLADASELELAQNATYPVQPGEDPSNVVVEPEDPQKRIAKYRAMKAAEDAGLKTRKTESEISENEANAAQLSARPDERKQALEIQLQKLEQAAARAEDANKRAELTRDIQMTKMQMSQLQFETREGRLQGQFEAKNHLGQGMVDRLTGLSSSMRFVSDIHKRLADPVATQIMGPVAGRTVEAAMKYLGGAGVPPEGRELYTVIQAALNQEAFENGGKALTGTELERFKGTAIAATDTLSTAMNKIKIREAILRNRFDDLSSLLSSAQANQAEGFMGRAGGAVPLDGSPPAGGKPEGGPKIQTWNPSTKKFE